MLKKVWVSLARWFDTSTGADEEVVNDGDRIDWVRMLPFVLLHAMCLGVIWVGASWVAVGVAAALYAIRMIAITGFYHRYFSHQSFKTNRFFQFIFAVVGNSAVQRGPLWWASHHRNHHTHSDQEGDVHSPHQHTLFWSHMGWITSKSNFSTDMRRVKDLAKYPELRFLDRFDILVPVLLGVFTFFLGVGLNHYFPSLNTNGMQMLIWGFFISTVVLFHGTCTINSLSHVFGTRRYETTDKSKNNFLLALVTFGEGWHNNHHYYPISTRQGFYWWEIDMTFYTLTVMSWFGIVRDLRPVPRERRDMRRAGTLRPETAVVGTEVPVLPGSASEQPML